MSLAQLLPKLGSWPMFVEAIGKLDDTLKSIAPQGARIGTVRGRDGAADRAALSAARKEANAALATLHRDAQDAGVTTDLASFKAEVATAAKPVLQSEGAHGDTLAFFDTKAGSGRPRQATTAKSARDNAVPPERQHVDRVGRIAPKMSTAEIPEDMRVRDVYGELAPVKELEGDQVRGSKLQFRAGGEDTFATMEAPEATPIPNDMRVSDVIDTSPGIDELIQLLQGRGKYLGQERFRGAALPPELKRAGNPMGTSGRRGEMQVLDPELGDLTVTASQPYQERIPGMGARRTYSLRGPGGGDEAQTAETLAESAAPGQQTLDELLASLMAK